MKKIIGMIFIYFFVLSLAACQSPGANYKEEDFILPLDIDFESSEDIRYFDVAWQQETEGVDEKAVGVLEDGAIVFGNKVAGGANFKARINYNTALHIRWKINAADTCFSFRLFPFIDQERQLDGGNPVGVSGCSYQGVQIESERSMSGKSIGTIVMDEGKWLDAVFWIEDEETPVLRAFIWETENPDLYFMEKLVLTGQEDTGMYLFSFDIFSGSVAVDTFRLVTGDIESYLWFHAPAFKDNYEKTIELFNAE